MVKHIGWCASIATVFLFAASLLLQAEELPRSRPDEVGMSAPRLRRLNDALQSYVDNGQIAGATTLVARRGKVVFFKSVGKRDLKTGDALRDDAIFRIASQTKAVISVAVMILQEEGALLIQDPVGKYMPEYMRTSVAIATGGGGYEVVDANRPITIRDLLTHTSGIGYGGGPAADLWEKAGIQGWYFADRDEPIRETVRRMAALPFEAQPRERFIYGYSTDILGALIEVVAKRPLDEFLQDRVFGPLGMVDTHFYLPPDKVGRLTTVYSSDEDGGISPAPYPGHMVGQGAYVEGPRKSFSGGAGLLSTATDYARFLQMLLNRGTLNGTRVLSRKSVELMTVDHLGSVEFPWAEGVGFGLGFSVLEDAGARGTPGTNGEYGWGGAYHTTYWVDPKEQLIVLYLTQLIPARRIDDHAKLRTLTYQAIEE